MKPTHDIIIDDEVCVNQLKNKNPMAVACLASIAILAGGIAAYMDWIGTEVKEDKIGTQPKSW